MARPSILVALVLLSVISCTQGKPKENDNTNRNINENDNQMRRSFGNINSNTSPSASRLNRSMRRDAKIETSSTAPANDTVGDSMAATVTTNETSARGSGLADDLKHAEEIMQTVADEYGIKLDYATAEAVARAVGSSQNKDDGAEKIGKLARRNYKEDKNSKSRKLKKQAIMRQVLKQKKSALDDYNNSDSHDYSNDDDHSDSHDSDSNHHSWNDHSKDHSSDHSMDHSEDYSGDCSEEYSDESEDSDHSDEGHHHNDKGHDHHDKGHDHHDKGHDHHDEGHHERDSEMNGYVGEKSDASHEWKINQKKKTTSVNYNINKNINQFRTRRNGEDNLVYRRQLIAKKQGREMPQKDPNHRGKNVNVNSNTNELQKGETRRNVDGDEESTPNQRENEGFDKKDFIKLVNLQEDGNFNYNENSNLFRRQNSGPAARRRS